MKADSLRTGAAGLRKRTHEGDCLLGTFVKTPAHGVVEVLSLSKLDYIVIDAEHAPIGLHALDGMLLAAHATGMAALVRIPKNDPAFINSCLDAGAAGVLVPHVRTAEDAAVAVAATHYKDGVRGFSPSARAGHYGTLNASEYLDKSDAQISTWCQIEDADALTNLDAIARVPGVDCLLIGRQDLALSMAVDNIHHPDVLKAVQNIAQVGLDKQVPVGIFVSDPREIASLRALGISIFICGSDQGFLLSQVRTISEIATKPTAG